MGEVKNNSKKHSKQDFIKWFSELNKDSGNLVGGKGANLAEIYNLKIPVPSGFAVTAQAYDYFIEEAGVKKKISELLEGIDYEDTEKLKKATKEVRDLIENSKMPEDLEEEILEAYEALGAEDSKLNEKPADEILDKVPEKPFVAARSSATAEDLPDASFAGQQDTFLNIKEDKELLESIKKCFASLFTTRATYYRSKKGFEHEKVSLSVIVQKMINSDKSGVIFSKDPSTKRDVVIIEAVFGLGEGIVSGQITPDRYIAEKSSEDEMDFEIEKEIGKKKVALTRDDEGKKKTVELKEEKSKEQVLTTYEIKKLADMALKLEDHYKKPQDIEFAIEDEKIYIVQTRPITTLEKRSEIERDSEIEGTPVLKGLAASPGIGSGKAKIIEDLEDLKKVVEGDVLVTKMTNPDMVVTMQKCSAIVTDEGGLTAHASIVSREMGIPAVVGTQEATKKLKDGEMITVDGYTGKIYEGKVAETKKKEIRPVSVKTKTKLKTIVDLPSFAERVAKSELKEIGLARIEGIIAESGKHPQYFLKQKKIEDYEEIIFKGIKEIAKHFDEIWVRTSDIRTDEFHELEGAPEEIETNPMLGMHGIRYSLKYPKILKAELNAMKRVSKSGKTIGIITPQVISVEEIQKLKEHIKEINFLEAKIGVMVETPASVQIIEELCDEGIDFISFGTNDLTQYTLAIDRGNKDVQNIYDETHPAVLKQIEKVIKACKEKEIETSICGQAGSKKEVVKHLVKFGIDSISVNADAADDIAKYVSELESENEENSGDEDNSEGKESEENEENETNNDLNEGEESKKENVEDNSNVSEEDEKNLENNEEEKDSEEVEEEQNESQESGEGMEVIEEEYGKDDSSENEQDESLDEEKRNDNELVDDKLDSENDEEIDEEQDESQEDHSRGEEGRDNLEEENRDDSDERKEEYIGDEEDSGDLDEDDSNNSKENDDSQESEEDINENKEGSVNEDEDFEKNEGEEIFPKIRGAENLESENEKNEDDSLNIFN